jgi:chaperonin GroEL (HSP60 family)
LRKTDNLRVARACGATIVNRTEEITEKDIGHGAGLFEVSRRVRGPLVRSQFPHTTFGRKQNCH